MTKCFELSNITISKSTKSKLHIRRVSKRHTGKSELTEVELWQNIINKDITG